MDYQDTLDAQYKAMMARHEKERKAHFERSIFPPKDGVPWSQRQKEMTQRHYQELLEHRKREAAQQRVRDVQRGNVKGDYKVDDMIPKYDPLRKPEPRRSAPDLDKNQKNMSEIVAEAKEKRAKEETFAKARAAYLAEKDFEKKSPEDQAAFLSQKKDVDQNQFYAVQHFYAIKEANELLNGKDVSDEELHEAEMRKDYHYDNLIYEYGYADAQAVDAQLQKLEVMDQREGISRYDTSEEITQAHDMQQDYDTRPSDEEMDKMHQAQKDFEARQEQEEFEAKQEEYRQAIAKIRERQQDRQHQR